MSYMTLTTALNLSGMVDQPLQKGSRVKISFTASKGKWTRATQIAIIEWRLESHKDFRIMSANYWGENYVSFDVQVMDTQALLTEKRIIEYILAANPKGFTLILVPKIKEAVGAVTDVAKDVFLPLAGLAIVVGGIILYLYIQPRLKK